MNPIVKNVLAVISGVVISGVVVGSIVNMGLINGWPNIGSPSRGR
jgi:hypothetical protein